MKKNILLDEAKTPDGSRIALYQRDTDYTIRIDGIELMSTRQSHSEEVLAKYVCDKFKGQGSHYLVGGLGFGFTRKAVLEHASKDSRVTTAELMECVIRWNLNPAYSFAHSPEEDPRSHIVHTDVMELVRSNPNTYHAILLDIDNGPSALTTTDNKHAYSPSGLKQLKGSLKPKGILGVWSSEPDDAFAKQFKAAGFKVDVQKVKSRSGGGSRHTIFFGQRQN